MSGITSTPFLTSWDRADKRDGSSCDLLTTVFVGAVRSLTATARSLGPEHISTTASVVFTASRGAISGAFSSVSASFERNVVFPVVAHVTGLALNTHPAFAPTAARASAAPSAAGRVVQVRGVVLGADNHGDARLAPPASAHGDEDGMLSVPGGIRRAQTMGGPYERALGAGESSLVPPRPLAGAATPVAVVAADGRAELVAPRAVPVSASAPAAFSLSPAAAAPAHPVSTAIDPAPAAVSTAAPGPGEARQGPRSAQQQLARYLRRLRRALLRQPPSAAAVAAAAASAATPAPTGAEPSSLSSPSVGAGGGAGASEGGEPGNRNTPDGSSVLADVLLAAARWVADYSYASSPVDHPAAAANTHGGRARGPRASASSSLGFSIDEGFEAGEGDDEGDQGEDFDFIGPLEPTTPLDGETTLIPATAPADTEHERVPTAAERAAAAAALAAEAEAAVRAEVRAEAAAQLGPDVLPLEALPGGRRRAAMPAPAILGLPGPVPGLQPFGVGVGAGVESDADSAATSWSAGAAAIAEGPLPAPLSLGSATMSRGSKPSNAPQLHTTAAAAAAVTGRARVCGMGGSVRADSDTLSTGGIAHCPRGRRQLDGAGSAAGVGAGVGAGTGSGNVWDGPRADALAAAAAAIAASAVAAASAASAAAAVRRQAGSSMGMRVGAGAGARAGGVGVAGAGAGAQTDTDNDDDDDDDGDSSSFGSSGSSTSTSTGTGTGTGTGSGSSGSGSDDGVPVRTSHRRVGRRLERGHRRRASLGPWVSGMDGSGFSNAICANGNDYGIDGADDTLYDTPAAAAAAAGFAAFTNSAGAGSSSSLVAPLRESSSLSLPAQPHSDDDAATARLAPAAPAAAVSEWLRAQLSSPRVRAAALDLRRRAAARGRRRRARRQAAAAAAAAAAGAGAGAGAVGGVRVDVGGRGAPDAWARIRFRDQFPHANAQADTDVPAAGAAAAAAADNGDLLAAVFVADGAMATMADSSATAAAAAAAALASNPASPSLTPHASTSAESSSALQHPSAAQQLATDSRDAPLLAHAVLSTAGAADAAVAALGVPFTATLGALANSLSSLSALGGNTASVSATVASLGRAQSRIDAFFSDFGRNARAAIARGGAPIVGAAAGTVRAMQRIRARAASVIAGTTDTMSFMGLVFADALLSTARAVACQRPQRDS